MNDIPKEFHALIEAEAYWFTQTIGKAIASLGYQVGMGIKPDQDMLKRAGQIHAKRIAAIVSLSGGDPNHPDLLRYRQNDN